MSTFTIKNVKICFPGSEANGHSTDLVIHDGTVTSIGAIEHSQGEIFEATGLHLLPGLFDLQSDFSDPGLEQREDLHSGAAAALAGGFTGVLVMPATMPPIDGKTNVEYVLNKTIGLAVNFKVAGTLSAGLKGEQLSEMQDMASSGAVAFTDYKKSVDRSELMLRALDYSRNFNGLVIAFPFDNSLCSSGQMHEGSVNVSLGLKGLPEITEEICLKRDIDLLRYTGGRMHISLISTAGSVAVVRQAKQEGLNVTCGVAAHQLLLTDDCLADFDTRFKVLPPLRNEFHRQALIDALKDGTIDIICSDHSPREIERKKTEFEYASFGMSSLETAFSCAYTVMGDFDLIAQKMSINPLNLLGMPKHQLSVGNRADFVLVSGEAMVYTSANFKSKSKNSGLFGRSLNGSVKAVFSAGQLFRN